MNILTLIETRLMHALVSSGVPANTPTMVKPSSRPNFGDYQCNAVMSAAKKMGVTPRELAQAVIKHLDLNGIAKKVEIAGPGFLNIYLETKWLEQLLEKRITDPCAGIIKTENSQTIVVDYSSPNVAKEMHVGHLRSTIIGDSTVRTLQFLGHKVIRQNHLGDWGTQFGMLIAYLEYCEVESQEKMSMDLFNLEKFYREAKKQFDESKEFADKARQYVVNLHTGDPYCLALWKKLVDITLTQNNKMYKRLNVLLEPSDVMSESSYNDCLPTIIHTLKQKKILKEDQGAKVVFLDEFKNKEGKPLGVIVEKSGGGYLYVTTDLAAIRHRCQTLNADRIIYCVDTRQAQYLQQLFVIARKADLASENTVLEHQAFGMMLGEDGRPFRSRTGDTVKLTRLLDEAEERAAVVISEKSSDLTEEQKVQLIKCIAIASVKYSDLSKNRTSDYLFNWDTMLSFEGNTAPYLLYAYARICSIFKKSLIKEADRVGNISLATPEEHTLGLTLCRFNEILEAVAVDSVPHILCKYLYDLSSMFMRFYEQCPINKVDVPKAKQLSRLQLCQLTARVLQIGFDLLGIETVEQI